MQAHISLMPFFVAPYDGKMLRGFKWCDPSLQAPTHFDMLGSPCHACQTYWDIIYAYPWLENLGHNTYSTTACCFNKANQSRSLAIALRHLPWNILVPLVVGFFLRAQRWRMWTLDLLYTKQRACNSSSHQARAPEPGLMVSAEVFKATNCDKCN